MKKAATIILLWAFTAGCIAQDFANLVNPFIGTSNYCATHPGAVTPNGMMSVTPFNVMGSDLNAYDKDNRWLSTPY